MTNAQIINMARQHLNAGNKNSYMKLLNSGIQKSGTQKAITQYATAAQEDGFRIVTTPDTIIIVEAYTS